ncbi:staygreen family protein [Salipaludibacillus daqingensis]|uniref:staygreen family protein n=1 Tax=Salipaludibacillus daqingensis TaxID=3041001 RepID=UPI002474638A|nr:staygreen family protein [Salipaludibacillus daqingensis]
MFSKNKLSVTFIPPASVCDPVLGRKYTLTHSDETGELFLSAGLIYDTNAIDMTMRDEVIAEWQKNSDGSVALKGCAFVDAGIFDEQTARRRYAIFKREISLALMGMVNGDSAFFSCHPTLLDSPIFIQYVSVFPQFHQVSYEGTPRQYLV